MSDLTDAQFAVYIDRILECRKAEDTAKEDTKQAYADLKDAGGDKTEAGLLVRALRMDEKDAGKAKAREEMLEEARLRYRRGKASHVRAREAAQSYAEAKGRDAVGLPSAIPFHPKPVTDTQEQPEEPATQSVPGLGHAPDNGAPLESEPDEISSIIFPSPVTPPVQAIADDVPPKPQDASSATLSNPQPTSSPAIADSPASTSSPEPGSLSDADVPAFLKPEQRKNIADYRPNCLHPDACAGSGLSECYACRKAAESEAA